MKRIFASLCALGVVLCGCSSEPPPRPNIVLVVMDTVRHDRTEPYGYSVQTTPFLEQLAESSTVFENAYSTSGWTSPAHASMFTGLYPAAHGTTQESWRLADDHETLAELLRARGYETVGLAENPMLSARNGFEQGFDEYVEVWRESKGDAHASVDRFRRVLQDRKQEKPLFAFINLMGAHSPYQAPRELTRKFVSDARIGVRTNLWREFFLGTAQFTREEVRHLTQLYDAEILYTDSLVEEIVGLLQEFDLWTNTVFVVTSDHGENIGDHGMMDHVFSLHESTTRVPLVVHDPAKFDFGGREDRPVQLLDLFPTLLERAGAKPGDYESQGQLLWRPESGRAVFCEYYYPKQAFLAMGAEESSSQQLDKYRRRIKSVRRGRYKFLWGSDGRHELYDLQEDPKEERNLIDDPEYDSQRMQLEALLREQYERYATTELRELQAIEPDDETRAALRAIGYSK